MDILRIRSFVMVARLGHLTRAADALHVTQPAVTAHIKSIEQELGIALFDRTPGKIKLTKAGEILLIEAERVLSVFGGMLNRAKEIKGEVTGSLSVAVTDDADFLRVGPFLSGLRNAFPLIQLRTRNCLSDELMEGVATKQYDGGYLIGEVAHAEIGSLKLRRVRYVAVAPLGFAAALGRAGWRDVAPMPWIAPPAGSHVRRLQNQLFANQGLTPNVGIECDQLSAIGDLVRAGLGMALMREESANLLAASGEFVIWPHAMVESNMVFVYRALEESSAATIGMLSVLKDCWGLT